MRGSLVRFSLAASIAVGALAPSLATAQSNVLVLGVRSMEGDDEFTRNLTMALRHAASQVEGWEVSDREVTLAQMALAHGCDDPDVACMTEIASSLSTQRVIYGDVQRSSAGDRFDFNLTLHVFNADTNRVEHSVTDTIASVRRDIDDLREPARRYVAALSGAPRVGTLRVAVNVPGAEVFIDDESVGVADGDGHLTVDQVQAGTRNVRIMAPGHQSFRSTISVEAWGEADFSAELQLGGAGSEFPVDIALGTGFLVLAAGLAAGWIGSWAQLQFGIGQSDNWADHQDAYLENRDNICSDEAIRMRAADRAEDLRSTCNQAQTLEVLEFVFGIGAAISGGLGLYFLINGIMGQDAGDTASIRLTPSVGPNHGYLGLTATF